MESRVSNVEHGIYVYSIIEAAEPHAFLNLGIGGRGDDVYTLHYKDLAALVSGTPLVVYDPTRENVLAHEHINAAIIEEGFTPMPMSFATLFKTENDVVEFLEATYDDLRDVLLTIKGKLEFGLRVKCSREEVPPGRADAYVHDIYAYLSDGAIASRSNKPIGDRTIMNAAFLVERRRAAMFDRKVQDLARQFDGKLSFRYTGPWPPYNFVTIHLQLHASR